MTAPPPFREALRFWLKLGFFSFGGPTGQIVIMHTELVERKKWVDEQRFLHALNYCMLLPGPEATQLATYCGWLLHGTRGGIVAGVLFVLPAAVLLWALSWIYVAYGTLPAMTAIFHGLKPAVTAIVVAAVITIGRRALKSGAMWAIAAAAFAAIFFWRAPFPLIVALAALTGWVGAGRFASALKAEDGRGALRVGGGVASAAPGSGWQRLAGMLALGLALWWAPVAIAGLTLGWDSVLVREGMFFSKASMVTFGGAYAVLPYVTSHAVEQHQWLTAAQMMDGLGLAETTPGPLIMVLQFVGFLGGWNQPGTLPPLAMATLGAAMTTWTTFVPAYLWIFLGAPYIERLRGYAKLGSALAAVTAAVVGVVLNLAVWFGLHVFLPAGVVDRFAVGVAVAAFVALQFFKVGMIPVVLLSGLAGWLWSL